MALSNQCNVAVCHLREMTAPDTWGAQTDGISDSVTSTNLMLS